MNAEQAQFERELEAQRARTLAARIRAQFPPVRVIHPESEVEILAQDLLDYLDKHSEVRP